MRVEPAERVEQFGRQGDRAAADIVDLAGMRVMRAVRVVVAAEIPAGAVAPDDAAGLLQAAIGIEHLGPDQPSARERREAVHQRVEPAGDHPRVVVEEQHEAAARLAGAGVATGDEAAIDALAQQGHAAHAAERLAAAVGRGVVHHDDLRGGGPLQREQAVQAVQRVAELAVHGDHDRHVRPHRQQRAGQGVELGDGAGDIRRVAEQRVTRQEIGAAITLPQRRVVHAVIVESQHPVAAFGQRPAMGGARVVERGAAAAALRRLVQLATQPADLHALRQGAAVELHQPLHQPDRAASRVGVRARRRHVRADALIEVRRSIGSAQVEGVVRTVAAFGATGSIVHGLGPYEVSQHFEAFGDTTRRRELERIEVGILVRVCKLYRAETWKESTRIFIACGAGRNAS